MTRRLFTAVRVPALYHERLISLQSGVRGARWVAPENFHITLSFLGDVQARAIEDLGDTLGQIQADPFSLTLSGTGAFGTKAPKLLWAGVSPCPGLETLQAKSAAHLTRAGFLHEARKYSPHVTLAYMKPPTRSQKGGAARLVSWAEATGAFLGPSFLVDEFVLVESHLSDSGAHYEDIASFPLTGFPLAAGDGIESAQ